VSELRVIPRAEWGADHGIGNERRVKAAGRLVIHHAYLPDIPAGASEAKVAQHLRDIEEYQAATLTPGNPRISYGHLIDQDGRAWEGLGWGRVGAHAAGVNSSSEAICFLIDSTKREPSEAAIETARSLARRGVELGYLAHDYQVSGHRDHTAGRTCPGAKLYARLQELSAAAVLAEPMPPLAPAPPLDGQVPRILVPGIGAA
jgi:hypothetical protein